MQEKIWAIIEWTCTIFLCCIAISFAGYMTGTLINVDKLTPEQHIQTEYNKNLAETDRILAEKGPCEPSAEAQKLSVYAVGTAQSKHSVWYIKYECPNTNRIGTIVWSPDDE